MAWSATQYSLFENERTRAVRDLLAAVPPRPVRHATDLGCGHRPGLRPWQLHRSVAATVR